MKYFVWILLLFGLFGCKEQKKHNSISKQQYLITDCFPYQEVDSICIYYTLNNSGYYYGDSVGMSIIRNYANGNQLSGDDFDFKNIGFIKTLYENKKIIANKYSINKLQSFFTPTTCPDDQYANACEPLYRDVILFYKNNDIIAGVKICFSCDYIIFSKPYKQNECFIFSNQYEKLKSYFNQNIHPIQ